ncbi:MAG: magnesium transporter [Planctomycetia bacterium]|nr:magnesium transporter [Planctomycetia bacterium]
MLQDNDDAGMRTFCENLHPATVAAALAGEFEVEEVWRFLQHTNIKNQAVIFEYFPIDWQVKMVEGTGRQAMAKLIEQMSPDDRAGLMRRLMPRVQEGLLRLVDEANRRDIAQLVNYQASTAGALMTTDYAWLPDNISAAEALDRLRLQAPDRETIYYIFILDDDRKLKGVVTLRDLILAPRHALIRDLMEEDVVHVHVGDDRRKVAQAMARFDLLAMPVVDEQGRLVGIVTHDDALDAVVEEATEDVHRLGAVGPLAENYLDANIITIWRKRVVWLAVLFIAEMFTFTAMAWFDDALKAVTVLALFVPLCISTGGNSGSQAATLIIRAMALGQVTVQDWFRVLRHELLLGILLGLALGAIGLVRAYFLTPDHVLANTDGSHTDPLRLALVIGQAVTAICIWGTLIGSMLPLVFRRLGVDPGFASSPFVATFVDVTGIVIYFLIAKAWLL